MCVVHVCHYAFTRAAGEGVREGGEWEGGRERERGGERERERERARERELITVDHTSSNNPGQGTTTIL